MSCYHKLVCVLFMVLSFGPLIGALCPLGEEMVIKKSPEACGAMPLAFVILGEKNGIYEPILATVCADMQQSGQVSCTRFNFAQLPAKAYVHDVLSSKFALMLVISPSSSGFEWWLYDTFGGYCLSGQRERIAQGSIEKLGHKETRAYAHALSHAIWRQLMSEDSCFGSRILFVTKQQKAKKTFATSEIFCCDFDGENRMLVYRAPGIVVAPLWNTCAPKPTVIFSEFTNTNVRFSQIILGELYPSTLFDLEGTSVGIAFPRTAAIKDPVYCRSGALWRYSYDVGKKKSMHTCVVKEHGACASPSQTEDGSIVYCVSGKIKMSGMDGRMRQVLVGDRYAVAPSYCPKNHLIVYSARIKGVMQLCLYDLKKRTSRQITFDRGDKIDPCWSPCGTFVAFTLESGTQSRIAVQSMMSGVRYFVSGVGEQCSYPSWG